MHKIITVKKLLVVLFCIVGLGTVSTADDNLIPLPPQPDSPAAAVDAELVDIIGQRAFTQTSYNTVNDSRGMHLGGVHVHKYGTGALALYVYDTGNNRILAFLNPDWTSPDERPDKVFGQNDSFLTGACNGDNNNFDVTPTARTLCLNRGAHAVSQEEEPRFSSMDTDSNGNLFIMDQYNNRALMFLDPFGTDFNEGDTTADRVWGQPGFNTKICNRGLGMLVAPAHNLTADGLCTTSTRPASTDPMFVTGLDLDIWGNLWVTDIINNRVLRYPFEAASGFPRLTADLVLGQPNLTSLVNDHASCVYKPEGVGFCQLFYVQVNDTTGEIFIIHDQMDPLISVYTPNTTAQNPTSYSYSRKIGHDKLHFAGYIHFVDANRFMVSDFVQQNEDGFHFFNTDGTFIKTMTFSHIVGQTPDGAVHLTGIKGEFLIVDGLLFVSEQRNHNSVLIFDTANMDSLNQLTYVGELLGGQNYVWNNITGLGVRSPWGFTTSEKYNQIYFSDGYRILVWNQGLPYMGRPADYVIGQPNFTRNDPTTSGAFIFRSVVSGLSVDEANNKLWVSRKEDAYAFNLPITASTPVPVKTLLTANPNIPGSGNVKVKGQSANYVYRAGTVTYDPDNQALWILDTGNSRIARVRDPYGTPEVDLIIGQNNINGTSCNRGVFSSPTAKTLCFPASAALDNFGNLYIAEGVYEGRHDMPGNKRIVEYDKATIDAAAVAGVLSEPAADRVYAMPNFTTNPIVDPGFSCLANTPCNPIGITFDPDNRMAVLSDAYFNVQHKRIFIYSNPLKNLGYVAFNTTQDKILPYAMGQGGIPSFLNSYQSFYQDHTWNRVLVVEENRPPDAPTYVQPANSAISVDTDVSLQWNATTDPDGDEVTYNVYVGYDEAELELVASNLTAPTHQATFASDTTIYWQIGATDGLDENKGDIWHFTTNNDVVLVPSVVQSKTSALVDEAGITDSYTVHLTTLPLADVNITLSYSQPGQIVVDSPSLTFTPSNWNVPQIVTLSAVNDSLFEGEQSVNILYSVTSEDEDYHALAVDAVVVTVNDNDPAVVELLTNNGFENDQLAPFNQPDSWIVMNKSKERQKCNTATVTTIAYEGECAYLFQGAAGEKAVLSQATKPVVKLLPGHKLNVRVYYRTNTVKPALKVRLVVYYGPSETAKREGIINQMAETYVPFDLNVHTVKAGKTITKVKLMFQNSATKGKIYIDGASLTVNRDLGSPLEEDPLFDLPLLSLSNNR